MFPADDTSPADHRALLLREVQRLAATGDIDAAEVICRTLLERSPEEPEAWSWRGLLASARANWTDAVAAHRQALQLRPGNPNYCSYLSAALRGLNKPLEAEAAARQAVEIDPTQPSYWANLASALRDQHQWPEAIDAYRRSLALESSNAATWQALAVAEQEAGNCAAARQAFEQALTIVPGGEATIGYSYLLSTQGQPQRAIVLLHDFLTKNPQSAMGWVVLAHALKLIGEFDRAEAACRQSLLHSPKLHESRTLLAELLLKRGAFTAAEQTARDLIADEAENASAWAMLGLILSASGQHEAAGKALRRSIALEPSRHYHSRLLCSMQYADGVAPQKLRRAHEAWNTVYASRPFESVPRLGGSPPRGKQLQLGLISADFCQHPLAFLALPALEALHHEQANIICYSERVVADDYTSRFRALSTVWRDTFGVSDDDLAAQIRRDEIDILFDLTGHQGERLSLFARKPAPVQITWLGYVGTTGLRSMDYILADRFHIRPGEEAFYTESVLRMPHGYACYGPPGDSVAVTPPPAISGEPFTFGCFNHPAKLSHAIVSAWAEILSRVPRSRLLLQYGGLDDPGLQHRLLGIIAERGIQAERIMFAGRAICRDLMAAYGRVDLALDTQPYSGGLTTCEALWMGVPVVTWPGQTFAGRHATSHLTNAGLTQFIADSREAYIELAVQWSSRIDELAALRSTLRHRMLASPLCNARQFAADLLELLQTVRR